MEPVQPRGSDPTRPRSSARPDVGSVIRDRILSKVDFPAPLRPDDADHRTAWNLERDVPEGQKSSARSSSRRIGNGLVMALQSVSVRRP